MFNALLMRILPSDYHILLAQSLIRLMKEWYWWSCVCSRSSGADAAAVRKELAPQMRQLPPHPRLSLILSFTAASSAYSASADASCLKIVAVIRHK